MDAVKIIRLEYSLYIFLGGLGPGLELSLQVHINKYIVGEGLLIVG
jgi:hypothetical protein